MKRKNILTLFIFVFAINISFAGIYSGGDGSVGNPYQIANIPDLEELMDTPADWSSYFILTGDIDCTGHTWANDNPQPIGNDATHFTGTFEGNSYTVSDIDYSLSGTDYVGFFGYIDGSGNPGIEGVITDLSLDNVNANGKQKVGGFVGHSIGSTISGCTASGDVKAEEWYSGGFAGICEESIITDCSASGDVTGVNHIGGFIGDNISSTIENCNASGDASSFSVGDPQNEGWYVAGFVGLNDNHCTISNCIALGDVSGNYDIGGFAGDNREGSKIINCSSSGKVSGIARVGGFVGWHYSSATIEGCSSTGTVSGINSLGGFAGQCYSLITNCKCSGNVSSLVFSIDWWSAIGGFVGYSYVSTIKKCSSSGNATCNTTITEIYVGGFIGRIVESTIENCSSTGDARDNANNTNSFIGGFAGYNSASTTENSFSYGKASSVYSSILGGFVGYSENGNYTCCFWNETQNPGLDDSGNNADLGSEVTPLTESQFSNPTNFSCFDFENTWIMVDNKPQLKGLLIPTLTEWAVIIFIGLLGFVGGLYIWKKQ
jgi:hypothetical protein